jgi:hypothetical protein
MSLAACVLIMRFLALRASATPFLSKPSVGVGRRKEQKSFFLVAGEAVSDLHPQVLLGARRADGARIIHRLGAVVRGIARLAAVVHVSGATDAAVAHGGSVLLAGGHATDLVVQGEEGTLVGLVGVARAAYAGEEAASGGGRRSRSRSGGGGADTGWTAGGSCAEGVACAAATGADIGRGGGSVLSEDVLGRHFECGFVFVG